MDIILNAVLTTALAHLVLGVILWLRVRKLYSYPGLLGFPVFGNLYYFYKTLFLGFMDTMDKYFVKTANTYGKNGICFHWAYGYRTSVLISSPEIVKEIVSHPKLSDKPSTMYGGFIPFMKGPLTSSHADDLWKQKRREYNYYFRKWHVDKAYYNSFLESGDRLIDSMLGSATALDPLHEIIGPVQDASLRTLFGVRSDVAYHPNLVRITTLILKIGSFIGANPIIGSTLLTIFRNIDVILERKIGELRKLAWDEIERTLVSENIPYKEKYLSTKIVSRFAYSNGSAQTYNKKQVDPEIHELFFTSSQTISSTLSNSLIFLAVLPEIQERAWQEQREIFGSDNREPTIDDIDRMVYLDRFVKESLRFLSPSFFGRLANEDISTNGITIPRGAHVIFLIGFMRMNPKYWKNPEVFDPDRFLKESDTLKYSYLAFGAGVRNCPGMYYAVVLMKVLLSKILRRLKLKPNQKDLRFEDIKFKSCLMTEVANPPLLLVEERV